MKRNNLYTALIAAILAFGLSFSAAMCLATGFDLTVEQLPRLMGLCALTALVGSILFQLRGGGLLFLLLSALLGGYLWHLRLPLQQLLALCQYICSVYDNAYHWGVPSLSEAILSADYPLMLVGYLAAAGVSFWGCRGRGIFPALAAVVLPLILCFVVTDTVPDAHYLFLIFFGCGIIVLTASVRHQSIPQGNRLIALTGLPLAAALALLFLFMPQEHYVNHSQVLQDRLIAWVQTLPQQLEASVSTLSPSRETGKSETVNLAFLSGQSLSSAPVLTVTAQSSGTLYLRGQDYDQYTGTHWNSDGNRSERFTIPETQTGDITIRTQRVQDILYIPYYPAAEISLWGGSVPNQENCQEYMFPIGSLSESQTGKYGVLQEAERYLALPEDTFLRASAILEPLLPESGSNSQSAAAIAAYVRDSAVYDLNPGRMPRTEEDFAIWFLEHSDRGYCVHFATASVVLLRAAGIPARYVTGYMATTQAGIPTTVTEKSAHAWAEFYEPQLDAWLILESTPAGGDDEPVPTTAPTEIPSTGPATIPPSHPEDFSHSDVTVPTQIPETKAVDWTWAKHTAVYLTGSGLCLLGLVCQRRLRLSLRRRKQTRGPVNSQALERWHEAERLSRLLKQSPTEELLILAQKAKFSQHGLRQDELQQFDSYLRACRQQLGQKKWYVRLIHQYIFAAY